MGPWSKGSWPKSPAFPTAEAHQPRSLSQAPLHNRFVVVTSSNILARKDLWRSLVRPVLNAGSTVSSQTHRRCVLRNVSIMQEAMHAAGPEVKLDIIHSPQKWAGGGHQLQHKGWWGQVALEGAC